MSKAVVVALVCCAIVIIAAIVITALILTFGVGSTAEDDVHQFECGKRYEHIEPRFITNGSDAPLGSAPWFVTILDRIVFDVGNISDSLRCGGSIIDTEWVITAKHCIIQDSDLKYCLKNCILVAGSQKRIDTNKNFSYGTIHEVKEQFSFYENTSDIWGKDVALIKVSPPFEYRKPGMEGRRAIAPVCLPSTQDEQILEKEGDTAGFGYTNDSWIYKTVQSNYTIFPKSEDAFFQLPENLQTAHVPIVTRDECAKIPDEFIRQSFVNFSNWREVILDRSATICAGYPADHRQVCKGDSGGPLTIDNGNATLVGITHTGLTEYCIVDPVWYAVYTRVSHFRDWIKEISGI